ncbi:MAG: glycosyltransferase [Solobacterium sp.]|nr:glycosyltransferase [Solobacterium sp.]
MKRVLFVLANEPTGGVGVFVRDFTGHFDERVRVDFLIYTEQRNTAFQNTIRKADTRIWYLPELTVRNYLKLLRLTDEFFYVHHREFDAVHLTYPGQVSMVLKPAKKYGIPCRIIHSFNASLSDDPIKSIRNKLFIMNYRKYANVYLACSGNAGRYLYGSKMAESDQVKYIMNAIDCSVFAYDENRRNAFREELGIREDQKLILAAGRLEKQKNIGFAAKVFAQIVKKDRSCVLHILGDGPLKADIEKQIQADQTVDHVVFAGFTNRLRDYFMAADLLLFPSLYEGLPITVVDAQCCGLPCVLSDTISDEVRLTDLISFRSLSDPADAWADTCLKAMDVKRRSRVDEITEKGYNIEKEALKLEKIYLDFSADGEDISAL